MLPLAAAAALGSGCIASYTTALGYRARQAADRRDADAFEPLMAEAAAASPSGPLDNPKRTVLSHFLALGGSERFFPLIEAWRAKGWVGDAMSCAIHRARWRGVAGVDPGEAERAAGVCLARARAASADPELGWELEACLAEAPFLTQTATAALAGYAALAGDPGEPFAFRAALLDGLTTVFLQDPALLRVNEPTLTREAAWSRSSAALHAAAARFEWILARAARAQPGADGAMVGASTAVGALELERVSLAHGTSFLGRYARSAAPDQADLAWAWVRAAKARARLVRHEGLGLYDRNREPAADAFWYLCAQAPRPPADAAEVAVSQAVSVLAAEPLPRPEEALEGACRAPDGAPLPVVHGPFPLEVSARAAVAAALGASAGRPVSLKLVGRVSLRAPSGPARTVTSTGARSRTEGG